MKFLIALISTVSILAQAQTRSVVQEHPVDDSKLGRLTIKVEDVGEPVQQPLLMSVTVECKDLRAKPNAAKPKREDLIRNRSICHLGEYAYDKKTKIMTVHFSTWTPSDKADSQCEQDWKQEFNLAELCEAWR